MSEQHSSGDQEWVRSAVSRFEGRLTLYATRILGDVERARDVVQETFLRLCSQKRARVEPHLTEWLFTVCRNRAIDVRRKEGRMATLSETRMQSCVSSDPAPAELAERRDSHSQVLETLETLPDSQRDVLRLKFQNGLSYREISGVTGFTESNVGFLIHTGLKAIRRKLVDPHPTAAQS